MRYTLATATLATAALAAPTLDKRQSNIDTTVLQFALTLEHLENVFYKGALQNFTEQDFMNAGYSANYYNNLMYIAYDEQSHVETLSAALSAASVTPNKACTYDFPYKDVPSFITLSSVLEGVGTSAYLGGAPLITSKQYLTVAGSILVTEAKHTSYQRAAVAEVPIANPYGTPLDPTSVYTLAAMFITSCPSSNAPLPFTPFPSLAYNGSVATDEEPSSRPSDAIKREARRRPSKKNGSGGEHQNRWHWSWQNGANSITPPSAGDTVTFTANSAVPSGSYLTFVSGLSVVSVAGKVDGKDISAAIPLQTSGQTYVFVTKAAIISIQDSSILYGPAILEVKPAAPSIDYSEQ